MAEAPKELGRDIRWELIQIQGILIEQVKQITRVIDDRRLTEIGRKELSVSLSLASERIQAIEPTNRRSE